MLQFLYSFSLTFKTSISFDNLFRLGRNWTNSEIGGCCIFDYNPLYTVNGINLETNPVSLGPIESNNTEWGWNESAELIGLSDNRIIAEGN